MGFRRPPPGPRLLGQVATPAALADAMAAWVLDGPRPARTLLEPGSGGFVFTRAALARAPELRAVGVDVDPAAGVAPPGASLVVGDFLDDGALAGRRFDAVLCNPPYIRHHYLDPAYKEEVAARLGARAGISLSRLCGTHIYFLLRALELCAPGGRLAFLTGAEWLAADYGAAVRRFLAATGFVRAMRVARPDAEVFPGVLATAAVLFLEKTPGRDARVAVDLDAAELGACAPPGVTVSHAALAEGRWTAASRDDRPRLGALFRARRGVATGANSFFVLGRDEARALRLPARHLRPCIATPRDPTPRWLLQPVPPLDRALRAYLASGEAAGVPSGYLCRTRAPWYRVETVEPAPLLIGYMSRRNVTVLANPSHAVHLNLLHGLYPRPGTPASAIDRLRTYLLSPEGQSAARTVARPYAGGLLKLEPRDLEAVPLPDGF